MSSPLTTAREQPLISHDEARRAAGAALDHRGVDGVEVVVAAADTALTRYAGSAIIQNTVRREVRAYVRAVVGDRTASATTNQLDEDHMQRAVARASEAARASPRDPDFPGLADPEDVGRPKPLMRWDDATAAATPRSRAASVARILGVTKGARAAGVCETGGLAYAVFSTEGVDCYDAHTRFVITSLVDTGEATGWAQDCCHAMEEVDVEEVAQRAITKARAAAGASDADPRVYQVVLEPAALATLLEYLTYAGFGAKQVIEGESFLSARSGEMVANPEVTVADDVFDPRSFGIGFDLEGVPKRRVAVINRGRATGPVTDLRTARQLGVASTGHFSGSNEYGPYASNVVMQAGESSLEELISGVDDGLLITRFHYVNILDRPQTLLTGMTRDGTFKIDHGEVAGAVRNLRFTQGVLDALASVEGIGHDVEAFVPDFGSFGSTVAPAARIGEFRFTSRTSH